MKGGTPGGRHSVSKGLKVRVIPVGCGERGFILIHGLRLLGPWFPLLPHPHADGHSTGALDPPSGLERQHAGSEEGWYIFISMLQKPVLVTDFVLSIEGLGMTHVLSLNSGSSVPRSRTCQRCWPWTTWLGVDMGLRAGKYG